MRPWDRFIHPVLGHFRRNRGKTLVRRYPDIHKMKVCDLGGSLHFWEASGLFPERLTILNISEGATQSYSGQLDQIRIVFYDGEHIPAEDKEFDLLVCNSVIEHVPLAKRRSLCDEMCRASRRVYLQTPAFEFPVEPHFVMPLLHWLPRAVGGALARLSPWYLLSRASKEQLRAYFEEVHLLRRSELQHLFPDAEIGAEHIGWIVKSHMVFWPKSLES